MQPPVITRTKADPADLISVEYKKKTFTLAQLTEMFYQGKFSKKPKAIFPGPWEDLITCMKAANEYKYIAMQNPGGFLEEKISPTLLEK